ncbi:hypothetical protein M8S61_08285 [Enterobacter asburiae]|uniref:hypothetical protein n=1 Tax=Enterobacter asburiae TaxID=61645 RepID=UPI00207532E7|nr:hypothetical protein [Enterobacter asburiae]MCM7687639.1 hypothetical protein [Enterobacter asburiae]
MSVKRYYWDRKSDCDCEIVEQPDGAMVDYDEHASVVAALEARCAALAAENAGLKNFVKTCFRAAADGASLDGADIQELGERLGLFGRETYQPALHGYICGHEAGEDSVYVMKSTPATDAVLAEVRAQGADECVRKLVTSDDDDFSDAPNICAMVAYQLRKGVQS